MRWLLLISLLIPIASAAEPPSLLDGMNPSFETTNQKSPHLPDGWACRDSAGSVKLVEGQTRWGKRCLLLESVDPMKTPNASLPVITVKPSTVYKLTFWARVEPGAEGAGRGMANVTFQYLDGKQKAMSLHAQYYGRIQVHARSPSAEWTRYSGAVMSPPGTEYARLSISPWRGTGKLWIDSLAVQEDPAASASARVPDGAEGRVRYFDFGKAGAAVWPGFEAVDETTAYTRESGFGWLRKDGKPLSVSPRTKRLPGLRGIINRRKFEPQRPDALCGDALHVSSGNTAFACDVPNGRYRVDLSLDGYGRRDWAKPDESYRVSAEGKEKLVFQMTRDKMLSDQYLHAWWDHDFDPTEDVWDTYVRPLDRVRTFDVEVRDEHLTMTMPNGLVRYAVVYAVELTDAVKREMTRVHTARRGSFHFANYTYGDPAEAEPEPEPSAEDRKRGYTLFARHYMTPIYPRTKPTAEEANPKRLDLFAARGEYEPTTFALRPLREIADLTVEVGGLRSADGSRIPSREIDVRCVRWFPKPSGGDMWSPRPVCLMPWQTVDLKAGLNRQFWITVHVPETTERGDYIGTITLSAPGAATCRLPLRVKVLPFSLDPLGPSHSWSYYTYPPQRLALPYEDRMHLARAFARELKRHSMNAIQIPPPDIRNMKDAETFELDFTNFDLVMEAAKAERLNGQCQVFTCGANTYYFKRRGGGEFTPSYNRGYKKYLALIRDHCKAKGWRVPLIWSVDEPREAYQHAANRNLVDTTKINRLAREVGGLRVTVTPMGDSGRGVDYLPLLDTLDVLQTHAWRKSERLIAGARKREMPWWSYNSGVSRYSWGIQCYILDAVGRWQWHYNSWPKFPHNPVAYSGTYMVVYPSPKGLIPSVAFEVAREGTDDYRYIMTLESAVRKAGMGSKGLPAARALLAEIKALPPFAGRNAAGQSIGGYGADLFESNGKYEELRSRIAEAIASLRSDRH